MKLRTDPLLLMTLALALPGAAVGQRTPEEAMQALREGNRRFAAEQSVTQPIGEGVRRTLARGQSPFAVVVTCADSQVPPEHLFNTGLGELVVVRTAGHVLGEEALATIEHAVQELDVPLCVVLGHENCDVVSAAIARALAGDDSARLSPAVVNLLERIEPAVRKARALELGGSELQRACQEEHAQAVATECLRRSELLRRYVSVDKVRVVAARYHQDGLVEWLPQRPLPTDPKVDLPTLLGSIQPGLPPHVSLRMLRAGHRRFLGDSRPQPDLSKARREQLAHGQQPLAIVVTDSDSRVSPEHVFDTGLGEIYVIRTAGNTLTDETLASIEFAASRLGASLLVVMGHDRCAPMAAAASHPERQQLTPNQRKLLESLEPSVAAARGRDGADLEAAARNNVLRTIQQTRSRSGLLRTLENQGKFAILAAFYDVGSGDLHWLKTGDHFESSAHASTREEPKHAETRHGPAAGHGAHAAHDGHEAPAGHEAHAGHETAGHQVQPSHDAHGEHPMPGAAASHDSHAHAPRAHDDHGAHAPSHHESHGAHDDLPVMEFPAAPAGETGHGAPAHHDAHGASRTGHDVHGHAAEHADHGHGADHGHDDHGVGGDHAPHGGHAEEVTHSSSGQLFSRWTDPVVVVGLIGIASLLFAAVLALKRS